MTFYDLLEVTLVNILGSWVFYECLLLTLLVRMVQILLEYKAMSNVNNWSRKLQSLKFVMAFGNC